VSPERTITIGARWALMGAFGCCSFAVGRSVRWRVSDGDSAAKCSGTSLGASPSFGSPWSSAAGCSRDDMPIEEPSVRRDSSGSKTILFQGSPSGNPHNHKPSMPGLIVSERLSEVEPHERLECKEHPQIAFRTNEVMAVTKFDG
jgi:hypothetical protein